MKRLYASLNTIEIHHLKNLLESAGIRCFFKNEFLHRLAGEVPFTECAMELWIERDADQALAEEIFAAMRYGAPRGPAWRCERCGETSEAQFTACWSCGWQRI